MKAYLMFEDRDFAAHGEIPWNSTALIQDLELGALIRAMADNDKVIADTARRALLSGISCDLNTIGYRQAILRDCIDNPDVVREIYNISGEAIDRKKNSYWGIFSKRYPSSILFSSIEMLQEYLVLLRRLSSIARDASPQFISTGFNRFFSMIRAELDNNFFEQAERHIQELKFKDGVLLSTSMGNTGKAGQYLLHKQDEPRRGLRAWLSPPKSSIYTFYIHPRDESGARALSELKDMGVNLVANALAQSNDHINSFFNMLQAELAFYVGCLNLFDRLRALGEPYAFPEPLDCSKRDHTFHELYDVSLALTRNERVVGNEVSGKGKSLWVITGANRGGKSTFLRSIGQAQLMMQCGMFVAASKFRANICRSLFTHFRREEDSSMRSGKFDEELSRMSDIADRITTDSLILFNESFAATNEREGSEIARQVVEALLARGVKVFFVTHLYEFAHRLFQTRGEASVFLRAERLDDTSRTFRLKEGEPLHTGFGEDLYRMVFRGV